MQVQLRKNSKQSPSNSVFQSLNYSWKALKAQEPVQLRTCIQGASVAQFLERELPKEGLVAQEQVQLRPCSQGASVAQLS